MADRETPRSRASRRSVGSRVPWRPPSRCDSARIIGLATEVSAAYITPSYKDVIAFLVLLIMMAVRPGGLLGTVAA
jgi:hypothetical protein